MAQIGIQQKICYTVSDLKELINTLPDDMPIKGAWDDEALEFMVMQDAELEGGRFIPVEDGELILDVHSVSLED